LLDCGVIEENRHEENHLAICFTDFFLPHDNTLTLDTGET